MGKIMVDMGDYREAITYLDKAKAAFEICGHYALGKTLLYLGKANQGLEGAVFLNQAKENESLSRTRRRSVLIRQKSVSITSLPNFDDWNRTIKHVKRREF
jgi:hypothetical protein